MRLTAVNFIRKSWTKSFNKRIVYHRFGFKCICSTVSRQYAELFHKLFTRATEPGRSMGGCNFRNIPTINVPKSHGGKVNVSWQETFKVVRILLSDPSLYPSVTDFVEVMNTLIQERYHHSENCITVKVPRRTQNVEIYLAKKDLVLPSLVRIWDTFSEVMLVLWSTVERKRTSRSRICLRHCTHTLSLDIHGPDWVQYRRRHESSIAALLCFFSKLKFGDIITTGQYMNYQTFSKLQFRPLLKSSFHSVHIDLKDMSGELKPVVSVGIIRLLWCSEKLPTFVSNLKDVTRWLLQDN